MSFFNTLGKRVRILREDRGLKQVDLAQKLERHGVQIGNPQISKIEAGVAMPSLEVLAALVRVLETTADYLLLLSDDPLPPKDDDAPICFSPEADEMAQLMDNLPEEARIELLAIARRLSRINRSAPERETLWWLARVEQAAGPTARQALERLLLSGDYEPNN